MLKTCQKSLVLPMKNVSVCAFKTSPFVPAQRAHMFQHVCAWCRYKRWRRLKSRSIHPQWRKVKGQNKIKIWDGPSAKDSVIFSGGDFSKNYGADQQRLQISDLHFDKFPNPATFACWKIRFKTEVCTCSQFPTEAMQWIKEVEMEDSVDELRSSSSIRRISMPNFEVLDARIASALNKIIHNSHFKRRISLE